MRSFGPLEREIMQAIWEAPSPVNGHEIAAALPRSGSIAYTTLITVVERLREKGLLTRERDGRSYRYAAAIPEDQYAAVLMVQVLESSHDRTGALLRFAGHLDPGDAAALREALERPPADEGEVSEEAGR